jgi:hypothetical protein
MVREATAHAASPPVMVREPRMEKNVQEMSAPTAPIPRVPVRTQIIRRDVGSQRLRPILHATNPMRHCEIRSTIPPLPGGGMAGSM